MAPVRSRAPIRSRGKLAVITVQVPLAADLTPLAAVLQAEGVAP